MRRERRRHPRYPASWELRGTLLLAIDLTGSRPAGGDRSVEGQISDVGGGGLCLITQAKAETATALRGEIFAPPIPVGIPTLLQVRWVHENPDDRSYKLGLQFLV